MRTQKQPPALNNEGIPFRAFVANAGNALPLFGWRLAHRSGNAPMAGGPARRTLLETAGATLAGGSCCLGALADPFIAES